MTHLTQTNSANNSKGRISNGATQTKGAKLSAQWLKNLCLEEGADDAGFVEAHRPALASEKAGMEQAVSTNPVSHFHRSGDEP